MSSYRRFIILSGPRTGSHMLAQALNSSPAIVCFREVYNGRLDFIQYGVDGYDDFSEADIALRKDDPVRFLHERIFRDYPGDVQAVGFKFHYGHQWDFPGIIEALTGDRELHVVELRRHNLIRMLVSLKLAERTGVWLQDGTSKLTPANLARAVRHPIKAARRVQRMLSRAAPVSAPSERPKLSLTVEECFQFMVQTEERYKNFERLFAGHPMLQLFYEDMTADRDAAFSQAQTFLGVEPSQLEVTLQQQNPQPLPELIANYDELRHAFKDTPQAAYFE
ncbi:MAG: hypothetical protein WD939_02225 [Dehalococcoidia bacterium]